MQTVPFVHAAHREVTLFGPDIRRSCGQHPESESLCSPTLLRKCTILRNMFV